MKRRHAFLPDPAGLFGLVVFLILSRAAASRSVRDGDTFWHIRFGIDMLQRGEIIGQDTFSHTAYGYPWHAHEWLSEVIMAVCYRFAGLTGVTLMYFTVVGLTFTLLYQTARRYAGDGPTIISLAIALPFALTHLLARPHIFTWLGSALTLHLLHRGGPRLWLLVPCYSLWANLHGGVLFGLVIQAIFIVGKVIDGFENHKISSSPQAWWCEHRLLFFVFGSCLVACFLNPFGYHLFTFPFKVASPLFIQEIGEWRAPNLQEMWYARALIILVVLMAISLGKTLAKWWWLMIAFLLWEALGHVRHLSLATLLMTPCLALFFERMFTRFRRSRRPTADDLVLSPWTGPLLILVLFASLMGIGQYGGVEIREKIQQHVQLPEDFSQPVIDFLKNGYPGERLLNEYAWGDYLLFFFEAPPKIFIDGRADMYGEEIFSDYLKITRLNKGTDELLEKYRIDWVLFPKDHILLRYLTECKGWQQVYSDEKIGILVKKKSGATRVSQNEEAS